MPTRNATRLGTDVPSFFDAAVDWLYEILCKRVGDAIWVSENSRNPHCIWIWNLPFSKVQNVPFSKVWQEGPGFDRNLLTVKAVQAALDYIHTNPVKRGLCGQGAGLEMVECPLL